MIRDIIASQRLLVVGGLVFFAFGLLTTVLILVDETQILGINRWIKPMKFFFSIAIFIWTMAVYLYFLKGSRVFDRAVSWIFILVFVVEMIAIAGQPLRGQTSHFNVGDPLNGMIFAAMGIAIAIGTVATAVIAWKYFTTKPDLPNAVVAGMRLGLVIFLLGSIQGGYMSANLAHTIGAVDGGPGLPLTNWSTVAGDLRVAHFLGLHAVQVMPILGFTATLAAPRIAVAATVLGAVVYLGFFVAVFVQALLAQPLIRL